MACPLLGGLSSFVVSFIGDFTVIHIPFASSRETSSNPPVQSTPCRLESKKKLETSASLRLHTPKLSSHSSLDLILIPV